MYFYILLYNADFTSSELDTLPFTFIRGELSHESHIQFSESHRGILNQHDFVTSNNGHHCRSLDHSHWRVKRATVGLAVTANFGDIVNPAVGGVSGSPLNFLVGGCIYVKSHIQCECGHKHTVL